VGTEVQDLETIRLEGVAGFIYKAKKAERLKSFAVKKLRFKGRMRVQILS